jgi:Tol biopolymer transport system component
MDADGGNARVVFEPDPEETAEPCRGPGFVGGWSPDSRRITYYSASVSRGIAEVCIVDLDGNTEVVVSDGVNLHAEPVWSPDGRYIAYLRVADPLRNYVGSLWITPAADGRGQRLVAKAVLDERISWQPRPHHKRR